MASVYSESHAKNLTYSDGLGLRNPVIQKKRIAKKRYTSIVARVRRKRKWRDDEKILGGAIPPDSNVGAAAPPQKREKDVLVA